MAFIHRALTVAILVSTSAIAQAQPSGPDWSQAKQIDVTMTNFAFTPDSFDLNVGVPYRIHFVNNGSSDHNFTSPEFFAHADIMPDDAGKLHDGRIEVPEGETVDVRVIPEMPGA